MGMSGQRTGLAALTVTPWLTIGGALLLTWGWVLHGGLTPAVLGGLALAAAAATGILAWTVLGLLHA
jgi:hypothetical protein